MVSTPGNIFLYSPELTTLPVLSYILSDVSFTVLSVLLKERLLLNGFGNTVISAAIFRRVLNIVQYRVLNHDDIYSQ